MGVKCEYKMCEIFDEVTQKKESIVYGEPALSDGLTWGWRTCMITSHASEDLAVESQGVIIKRCCKRSLWRRSLRGELMMFRCRYNFGIEDYCKISLFLSPN